MLLLLALACVDYAIADGEDVTAAAPGQPGGSGGGPGGGPGVPGGPGGVDTGGDTGGDTDAQGPGGPGGPGGEDTSSGPGGPGSDDTGSGPADTGADTEAPRPGSSADHPRSGDIGDWVITELMINPAAVSDSVGEWVELSNLSADWLTLEGHYLADDNLDRGLLTAAAAGLVVAPGSAAVLCAEADPGLNGGVTCAGVFEYTTFGDGFALANTGDEAALLAPDGVALDVVAYGDGFAATGASVGVSPDWATPVGNDDTDRWCAQTTPLSGGDSGTPGAVNTPC